MTTEADGRRHSGKEGHNNPSKKLVQVQSGRQQVGDVIPINWIYLM
jgi:hypothetical protein